MVKDKIIELFLGDFGTDRKLRLLLISQQIQSHTDHIIKALTLNTFSLFFCYSNG